MIRILAAVILSVQLCSSAFAVPSVNCQYVIEGGKRYYLLAPSQIVPGVFKCGNCGTEVIAAPDPQTKQIKCASCGNPFDAKDSLRPPPFLNRGGQNYVPKEFHINDPTTVSIFKEGPDWECGSCKSLNAPSKGTCVSCGDTRDHANRVIKTGGLGDFGPHNGELADPVKMGLASKHKSKISGEQDYSDESVSRLSRRQNPLKNLIVPAALAGFLTVAGAVGFYETAPQVGPLTGQVVSKTIETMVFPDENTYHKYSHSYIDGKNPPSDVAVFSEKDVNLQVAPATNNQYAGFVIRRFYVQFRLGSTIVNMSVNDKELNEWQKGDKVKVQFQGPADYNIEKLDK